MPSRRGWRVTHGEGQRSPARKSDGWCSTDGTGRHKLHCRACSLASRCTRDDRPPHCGDEAGEEQRGSCSSSCTSTHALHTYDYDMRQLMTTRGDSSVSVHASDIAGANTSPNMCLGSAHDTCTDTHLVETTAEKETRHVHFAEWLVRVFGNERLRAGTGVVDVAGGKGALYPALCSTLVPANGGASAEGDTAAITTTAATVGAVPLAPPWPGHQCWRSTGRTWLLWRQYGLAD